MSRARALAALQGFLETGRDLTIDIKGTSMEPFLRSGDRVHVQAVPPSGPGLGDLIAYRQEGQLIVHRYAGRTERGGVRYLCQKGDNVRGHGLVHPDALVGRVVWVQRGAKRVVLQRGPGLLGARWRGLAAWGRCFLGDALRWCGRRLRGGPA